MPIAHPHIPEGTAPQNFAPVSKRDRVVFGSWRPAFSPENEIAGSIDDGEVSEWAKFMKEQGVKRVVSLLSEDELKFYKTPLEQLMTTAGFEWTRAPVKSESAADKILEAFEAADKAGEKVVVHCSAGAGRTSLAAGLWLTSKYNLSPEEAAREIAETAAVEHAVRTPDAAKLAEFIKNGRI